MPVTNFMHAASGPLREGAPQRPRGPRALLGLAGERPAAAARATRPAHTHTHMPTKQASRGNQSWTRTKTPCAHSQDDVSRKKTQVREVQGRRLDAGRIHGARALPDRAGEAHLETRQGQEEPRVGRLQDSAAAGARLRHHSPQQPRQDVAPPPATICDAVVVKHVRIAQNEKAHKLPRKTSRDTPEEAKCEERGAAGLQHPPPDPRLLRHRGRQPRPQPPRRADPARLPGLASAARPRASRSCSKGSAAS